MSTDGKATAAACFNYRWLRELPFRQGQVESIVEPDGVTDDIWRKAVTFICIHHQIIPFPAFNLSVPMQLDYNYIVFIL